MNPPSLASPISAIISKEIGCQPRQVTAAIELLDEGATIPFIARYRKEATGGLDDTQLRTLEERLEYLRDLDKRKETVFRSISEQGKMTDELAAQIVAVQTKAELEDLYLPYKPKRRTKADIAREKGLGPLADAILADMKADPEELAKGFISAEVEDVKAALDGARDIIAEKFSENAEVSKKLRDYIRGVGRVRAKVLPGKETEGENFKDYFDHQEDWSKAAGHRILAMLRARDKGIIELGINVDEEIEAAIKPVDRIVIEGNNVDPSNAWLVNVAKWTWRVKLATRLNIDLMSEMRVRAETEAIDVFARNLKDLLLAAPAGPRPTMGLDPGIRTGVKVAVVDGTGKLVATHTVYPFAPRNDLRGAINDLSSLIRKHKVELIAIGNGTASRETDALVAEVLKGLEGNKPTKVIVSEAGASVYSASAIAAAEMPDIDVSLRGAVSIARRLQDPLAELVKIEPKSIGVGQYQHDVDSYRLAKALDASVEDAVNAVGVDLNTASAALLSRVSGLNKSLAEAIVAYRDENGPFKSRKDLLKVPRLGARAFEQCAGFLRIRDGEEPLDASAVHPEAYDLAKKIVAASGKPVGALMGDKATLKKLNPVAFVDDRFGLPTVRDIITELEKPGRDPRPEFKTATLAEGVNEITDLKVGMTLEGTVTNVAAFGAFVDIGVHQDGLVHISELADRFVKDPSEVVKTGDIVTVKVIDVDVQRKRIALSMRKNPDHAAGGGSRGGAAKPAAPPRQKGKPASPGIGGLGDALLSALKDRR